MKTDTIEITTTSTAKAAAAAAESHKRSYRAAMADLPGRVDKKFSTGPQWNMLYKTRLCANYQNTGACPYFQKCQFAHGEQELARWEAWRQKHFGNKQQQQQQQAQQTQQPQHASPKKTAVNATGSEREEPHFHLPPSISLASSPATSPVLGPSAQLVSANVTYDNVAQILRAPALFETQEFFQKWQI